MGHKDCAAGKIVGLMDCRLPFLIERFDTQDEKRRRRDLEAQMIDYDFINALCSGRDASGSGQQAVASLKP